MFPKIKKRLGSFLVGEDGKISKQALVALGAFLGSGVLAGVLLSKEGSAQIQHTNDLAASYGGGTASATHSHHSNDITPPPSGDVGDSGACGSDSDVGCGCADAAACGSDTSGGACGSDTSGGACGSDTSGGACGGDGGGGDGGGM